MSLRLAQSVTLRDVARECGLSVTTVSAVVRGAEWVPADTRARVRRAVDALGYRPNPLARGLKTRQGYAVGVMVSDIANPFFIELVRCVGHALRDHGWPLFLADSDLEFGLAETNLRMLLDAHIVGLVLLGDAVAEDTLRRHAPRLRMPVVSIDREYDIDTVNCFLVDSEHGAYTVTRHLIDQGARRAALIGGPREGPGSYAYARLARDAGYRRALLSADRPVDEAMVVEGFFNYAGGRDAMLRLLGSPRPPDAVFAANDVMALGALDAARQLGVRIPEDVALAGFDDIRIAALTDPPLTTLATPIRAMANAAAALLAEQIPLRGAHAAERRVFSGRLVVRESSLRGGGGGA